MTEGATEMDETVYDRDGNVVEDPDLELGDIVIDVVIRPDAEPIDNETKHAWADEDYVERRTYVPYPPERLAAMREGRAREEFAMRGPARLDVAEAALADADDALCALYEDGLARQAEFDDALCAIYEMQLGGE